MLEQPQALNETVAEEMVLGLARRIDEHVETHLQNAFIQRTGVARNRIFRIKDKLKSPDMKQEIRFSIPELARIAKELRYITLTGFIEDVESEALRKLDRHTNETLKRRRAIELAAMFLKLSESEMEQIRTALELVSTPSA